ncbi:DUF4097 family beta strand repeat-containing protein [Jidongwangia harbinensis]|uniref:DUF4097 family beta strand repeat-containing protein n=1 Tax=Jidongwangia harbinensis TaxID=2878561 RepID=UPI001CDA4E8F|nr:DUF4097 family beta strand repeat-containing protein [Jidongwangia harbinensis]MCA2217840.1 DUF4097 domain-containing protein [Jidongwangia harbinensis]
MTTNLTRRTGALAVLATAAATVLAGCDNGVGARLTFHDTEKVKVSEIVMAGGSGDVAVKTAAITETRITRVVHRRSDPEPSYRLEGTVLHIDTDCGRNCTASYQIEAPAGVKVRGELRSGDVALADVGAADLKVTSGNIAVAGSTGAVQVKTTSGDIVVHNARAGATLNATSGDLRVMNANGGPVNARTTSGDVEVRITEAASVTAHTTSGDVEVLVPSGAYQVRTNTNSGDAEVAGVVRDPASKNVLDIKTSSGDATVAGLPAP